MPFLLAHVLLLALNVAALVWGLRRLRQHLDRLDAVLTALRAAIAALRSACVEQGGVRATFNKLADAVTDLQQHVGVEQETRRAIDETAATLAVLRETAAHEAEVKPPRPNTLRGATEPWGPGIKPPAQGVPRRPRTR